MKGWLMDVQPDYAVNSMVLWIKTNKGIRRIVDHDFRPVFYVFHESLAELKDLAECMNILDEVAETRITRKKLALRPDKKEPILAVYPRNYSELNQCARVVDSRGGYYDYDLYNVDLRLGQRYMLENGLFPFALLDLDNDLEVLEGQFRIDYSVPNLTEASLEVQTGARFPGLDVQMKKIRFGGLEIEGDEEAMLKSLLVTIRETDPDIIFTDNGDDFTLPYLYRRAELNDIPDFYLGREQEDISTGKKGRSYFSYGSIVYKPPARILKGRLHIDRSQFVYGEGALEGIIELSRLSCLPIQNMARMTPGSAISAMQVQHIYRQGYLIAWKKNLPEDFKTADELLLADRGGIILDPIVGIHEGIVEADFVSLYPNIMAVFNISPETIMCDCCPDTRLRVPELLYGICEKRRGMIAKVVLPLVHRRMAYKKLVKERPDKAKIYKRKSNLLKWVLVTCFGYTGYKNARFGRIECHESINAFGRDIFVRTMDMAEKFGYEVLHGIVDSVWLKPNGFKDHDYFCKFVSKSIGIPLELEGVYKWIVFLPNKGTGAGALNRYYGLFENGEYKLRGIELRKHDTPPFIRKAQMGMLDVLARADGSHQFRELIPEVIDVLKEHSQYLKAGSVEPRDLILTKRISKTVNEYSQFNDQAAALKQYESMGVRIEPGKKIRFIVCDSGSRDYRTRVKVKELIEGVEPYDVGRYTDLLARSGETLLAPFGHNEESLRKQIG